MNNYEQCQNCKYYIRETKNFLYCKYLNIKGVKIPIPDLKENKHCAAQEKIYINESFCWDGTIEDI